MRVVLFGANDLSLAVAKAVVELPEPVELAGVVHVPDRFSISYQPDGVVNARHRDLGGWARSLGMPEQQWNGPDDAAAFVASVRADIGIAAGWYHMLPRRLRDALPLGVVGAHASLLPLFRGGAPLNWALLSGAEETGLSLFQLQDGVDTGPVYDQRRVGIDRGTTIGDLVDWVSTETVAGLRELLPKLARREAAPREQTGTPSYALMRVPEDGALDWRRPVDDLDRLVRAVGRPYPGAFTSKDGSRLIVWRAQPVDGLVVHGRPGQLARVPETPWPVVVTGQGVLALQEVADESGADALPALLRAGHQRLDVTPA